MSEIFIGFIYLIGGLRDPDVRNVAFELRSHFFVFDDWHAAGPEADRLWRDYEIQSRGHGYVQALQSDYSVHVREFDQSHLHTCAAAVAVCAPGKLPGRSAIAELSYVRWCRGRPVFILLRGEPQEWDQMLPLAVPPEHMFYELPDLIASLHEVLP